MALLATAPPLSAKHNIFQMWLKSLLVSEVINNSEMQKRLIEQQNTSQYELWNMGLKY